MGKLIIYISCRCLQYLTYSSRNKLVQAISKSKHSFKNDNV